MLRTPDGDEFPHPGREDVPSEEEAKQDAAGELEDSPIDLDSLAGVQPPLAVPITFVLECRAPFTPQVALELIRKAAPEAELVGGGNPENKRILASERWASFDAWDPATGLSLCFERVRGSNPIYVRVACDLLEDYVAPTEAGRREAASLAVRAMQSVTSSLAPTVIDVER